MYWEISLPNVQGYKGGKVIKFEFEILMWFFMVLI